MVQTKVIIRLLQLILLKFENMYKTITMIFSGICGFWLVKIIYHEK